MPRKKKSRRMPQDRILLAETALEIAKRLAAEGATFGVQPLSRLNEQALKIQESDTDGWSAQVGKRGSRGVSIEIWVDRFTGGESRRFYAGFAGSVPTVSRLVSNLASERERPLLTLTQKHVTDGTYGKLRDGLPQAAFGAPILEKLYHNGFFGIYSSLPVSNSRGRHIFIEDAIRFLLAVSAAQIQRVIDPQHAAETLAGQGQNLSIAARRAVENRAVEVATEHYKKQNYKVYDRPQMTEHYDLLCRKGRDRLTVEVKGTTSRGNKVIVTHAEAEHAKRVGSQSVLAVVRGIKLSGHPQAPVASGGSIQIYPFRFASKQMKPLAYEINLPRKR